MKITDKEKKKLIRLAEIADEGEVAILKQFSTLEEETDTKIGLLEIKVDTSVRGIEAKAAEAMKIAVETQKMEGKAGKDGDTGPKGDSYVLTDKDKKDIADNITVPIVEKTVVEKKVEIIKEIPIVRETVKETITEDLAPQEIRDRLELLSGDERIDAKYIKNLPESKQPFVNRVGLSSLPDVNVAGIQTGQTLQWNGVMWVAISSSSGSTILTATGTVNDSNVTFTYVSKPTLININGAFYRENHGWSWNSGTLTATYDNVVGIGGDTFGI